MYVFVGLLLLARLAGSFARPNTEFVTLQDLNSDHYRRNLDGGLPSYLDFSLQRRDGNVNLRLVENDRLPRNPPVYLSEKTADGRFKWVETNVPLIESERFYQDLTNEGAFSVQCELDVNGPCRRVLTGNLFIDGWNFDIIPATGTEYKRGLFFGKGTPHLLIETEILHDIASERMKGHPLGYERHNLSLNHDYKEPVDMGTVQKTFKEEEQAVFDTLEKLFERTQDHRSKRAPKTKYTVELGMMMDPILFEREYNRTAATANRTRNEETYFQLRRRACQITNLVSLRYRSITDSDVEFDVTLSTILIKPERDETWNLPTKYTTGHSGQYYTDGNAYLEELSTWLGKQKDLPTNIDHLTLMTGMNIQTIINNSTNDGLMGITWRRYICYGTWKISVVEDLSGFYTSSWTLAHELGHSLGADHDSVGSSYQCSAIDKNIMTNIYPEVEPYVGYSARRYRFSKCSVAAFKKNIRELQNNCLLNDGAIYNLTEWTTNSEKLPGEIYDHAAQCKLMYGSNSKPCATVYDGNRQKVCEIMECSTESGFCWHWNKAATGTACGTNQWCIEGICVKKNRLPAISGKCVDRNIGYLDCPSARKKGKYTDLDDFCYFHSTDCCKYCSNRGVKYRLINNDKTNVFAGRLEVFYNNEWGTVCNDNFGLDEANVACKSMNFSRGIVYAPGSYQQGATSQKIWMDDVACNGQEETLGFCTFPEWGSYSSNCNHSKDVMIKCIPKVTCKDKGFTDSYSPSTRLTCATVAFSRGYFPGMSGLEICDKNLAFANRCCKFCADRGYDPDPDAKRSIVPEALPERILQHSRHQPKRRHLFN